MKRQTAFEVGGIPWRFVVALFAVLGVVITAISLGLNLGQKSSDDGKVTQDSADVSVESENNRIFAEGLEIYFGPCEGLVDSPGLRCPLSVASVKDGDTYLRIYDGTAYNSDGEKLAVGFESSSNGNVRRESQWKGEISSIATRRVTLLVSSSSIALDTFQCIVLWVSTSPERQGTQIIYHGPRGCPL